MAQIPSVFNASQYFGNTSAKKGQQDSFFDHQSGNTNSSTALFQDPFDRNLPTEADSSMSDFQDDFDGWDAWPSQEDQFLGSDPGYQNNTETFYNSGSGPKDSFGYQQSQLLVTDNDYGYHEDLSAESNSAMTVPPPHVEPAMDSWIEQKEAQSSLHSAYYSTQASSNTSAAQFFDQDFNEGSNSQPPYSNAEMKQASHPHQSFVYNQSSFPDLHSAFRSTESRPVMTSNRNEQQDSRFLNDQSGKSYASVCQPSPPAQSSQHNDSTLDSWREAPCLESYPEIHSGQESSQHFSSEFPHYQQNEQIVDSWSREPDIGSWSPVFSHDSGTIPNGQQMETVPSGAHMEEARGTNPLQTFQNNEELDTSFHNELPPYSQHGPLTTGNQKEWIPTAPHGQSLEDLPPDNQLEVPHAMLQTGLEDKQMQSVSHAQVFHPFERSQTETQSNEMYQFSEGLPASFHQEVHHPLFEAEPSVDERGRDEDERQASPHPQVYQPFGVSPASLYQDMPHPTLQGEHMVDHKGRQLEEMQASQPQSFRLLRESPAGLHQEVPPPTSQGEHVVDDKGRQQGEMQASQPQVFQPFRESPAGLYQEVPHPTSGGEHMVDEKGTQLEEMHASQPGAFQLFRESPAGLHQEVPHPTSEGEHMVDEKGTQLEKMHASQPQAFQLFRESPTGLHQEVPHPTSEGEQMVDEKGTQLEEMHASQPQVFQPFRESPTGFHREVPHLTSQTKHPVDKKDKEPEYLQSSPHSQIFPSFGGGFHQEVPDLISQEGAAMEKGGQEADQVEAPGTQVPPPSVTSSASFNQGMSQPASEGDISVANRSKAYEGIQVLPESQMFQPFRKSPAVGFHQEVFHPSPQGELAADVRDKGSLHTQAPPPAQTSRPSGKSSASFNQEVTNHTSQADLSVNNRLKGPEEIQNAPQVLMLQPFEGAAADFQQEVPHQIPQREQAVDDRGKESSRMQASLAQISQSSARLPASFIHDITLPTSQGMLSMDDRGKKLQEMQTSSHIQMFQPFGGLPAGFHPPYSTMQESVGAGDREQEQQLENTPQLFQPTQVASSLTQNVDLSEQEVSSPVKPATNNLLVEPESPQDAVQAAFQQKKLAGKEPAASPRTSLWTNGASLLAPCMLAPAAAVRSKSSDPDCGQQAQPIIHDQQQQMEDKYVPPIPVLHQGAISSNVFHQPEHRTVQPIHGRLTAAAPAPVPLGLTTVPSSLPSLACEPVDAVLQSELDVAPRVANLPPVDSTPVTPPQQDVTTQLGNFGSVGNNPGNPILQPQEDVAPLVANLPHTDAFSSNIERDYQETPKAQFRLQTSQPAVVPRSSAREVTDNLLPATLSAERGMDYGQQSNFNQLQCGQNQEAVDPLPLVSSVVEEHNQPKQRTASVVNQLQSKPEMNTSLASILQGGSARHKKKQSVVDSDAQSSMDINAPQEAVASSNTDTLLSRGDSYSEQHQGLGSPQTSGHKVEDNSPGVHERGVDDPHLGEYPRQRDDSYYGKDRRDYDRETYDRTGSGTRDYDQREHDRKEYDGRGFDRREYYKDYNRREYDERDHERREYDRREYGGNDPDRGEFGRRDYDRRDDGRRGFDQKRYDKEDYDRREYDEQDYDRRSYNRKGYDRRGPSRREYDRREYDGRDDERDFDRREYGKKDYDRRELSGRDYNRRDYQDGREFDRRDFDRRDFDRRVSYDRQNPYESPSSPGLGRRGYDDRRSSRDDMYGVSDGRDSYYSYHGGRNTPSSGRNSPGQDYAPQSYPPYQYGYPAYTEPTTTYGSTEMYNYLMMLYHYYPQHYEQFIAQQGFYHAGYGSGQQGYSSGYGPGYESFQEVAGVGVADIEPQRTTPYLFRIQHPIVRFNGGRMISLIPSDDIDERPSCVVASVQMVFTEREFENIKAFAGPLTRYSSRTEVIAYCEARSAERDTTGEGSVKCLLWRVLANLVKHNGAFVTSELAELIMENWRGNNHSEENELLLGHGRLSLSETESRNHLQVYREMLLAGATKDALEYLMRFQMWGHALMLASKMDKKVHNDVMNRFMRTMGEFDPIRTVYDHLSGRQPAALVATDDWQRHLAAMVANPSRQQPECNKKNIMHLGDTLMADEQVCAAHLCFLLAGVRFGFPSEPNTKVVLLGIDHRKRDLTSQHIPLDNLQMMEILEYATSLSNEEYDIPSLQTYKFLHAMRLSEAGFTDEALHYMEVIGHNIIKHPHHFNTTLVKNVKELTDRLNTGTQDATEVTEMLEKLLEAKDSSQISSSISESEEEVEDQLAESSASFLSGYDPAAQLPQQPELQQQEEAVQPESSWAEPPPAALRSQDSVSDTRQDSWPTGMAVQSDVGMQYPPSSGPQYPLASEPQYPPSSGPQASWGEYPSTTDPPSQVPFFTPQGLVSQQIPDPMGGAQPAVEEQPPFMPQPSWGEGYQSSWSGGDAAEESKTVRAAPPKEDEPAKKEETKSEKSEKKKKKGNNHNQGGWFSGLSGIIQKVIPRGPNEMILPDDSKKSIYWDEELKRWVDTEEDEKDKAPPPPPPSDLQLIGGAPPKMNTANAPFLGGMTSKANTSEAHLGGGTDPRVPTSGLKLGGGMPSWTPTANGNPFSSGSGGPGIVPSGSPLVPALSAANQQLNSSAPDSPATVSRFSRKAYGGTRLAKKYVDILNPTGKGTSAMSLPTGLLPMMPSPSTEFKGSLFTPAPVSTPGESTYDQRVDQPAVGNPSSRPSSRTEEEDGGDMNSQHSRSSSASLTSAEVRSYMMPQDPDPPPQDVNSPPPPMFYNPMAFAQPRTPAASRKPRYPGIRQ